MDRIGALACPVPVFDDRASLGAALPELGKGVPVVVVVGAVAHLVSPADAVGHSATRRLIDLPMTVTEAVDEEVPLSEALRRCGDAEHVLVQTGRGSFSIATRLSIVEALLARVSTRDDGDSARATARVLDILDQSPDGVVVLHADGRLHAVNRTAQSILSLVSDARPGERISTLGGVPVERLVDDAARGTPRDIYVHEPAERVFSIRCLRPADPSPRDMVLLLRDVTHLRHRQAREAAIERMAMLGQLASGIAHDLNNVLTVVMTGSALLAQKQGGDRNASEELDRIEAAASRAAGLVRQLLAFARRELAEPVPVDLSGVVRGIEGIVRRLAGDGIDVVFDTASDLAPIIADPVQVERIVTNLVSNARNAMPRGGRLLVSVRDVPECTRLPGAAETPRPAVALVIQDDGVGMGAETLARVFEPFFTTRPNDGTGLGLATVLSTVQQLGGHIDVESQTGAGSCFTVVLPVDDSAQVAYKRPPPQAKKLGRVSGTLLLVDSDPMVLDVLRRLLEHEGYRVALAGSWQEVSAVVDQTGEPDLLIVDAVLQDRSGIELVSELRDRYPKLRALVMSGFGRDDVVLAAQHPFVDYISKPFGREQMLSKIAAFVGPAYE